MLYGVQIYMYKHVNIHLTILKCKIHMCIFWVRLSGAELHLHGNMASEWQLMTAQSSISLDRSV